MKTKLIISAAGLLLLASCAKTDLYDIDEAQKAAAEAALCWITDGTDAAMSRYNGYHGKEEEGSV